MKTVSMKCAAMILAVFAIVSVITVTAAHANKSDVGSYAKDEAVLDIMLGKAEMVTLKGNVSDVMVANPGIVDVMAVKSNQLYLVGNALGDTNIMVLDDSGNILRKINVHVQMDTKKLEDMILDLYPNEKVRIRALTDQLVLTGHVSTPSVSNNIANLVAQYAAEIKGGSAANIDDAVTNMLTVAGEQQVMLKVKIIEASRSAMKDLGIETRLDGEIGAVGTALTAASGLGLASPVQLGVLALNYASGSFGNMGFLARALEEEGIVNTLAEPNLTAISGEQAGFLAGGEIPIPTELDRNGNLVYEFRPFGVSLNFRPTVMSSNRISMEMTTEVSNASYDDNLQLQGINVPTFNVRRAQTTVELPSGGTLMIAGLLQSDSLSSLTQLPGVNKIPVVGDLLKSDSFQRKETELVVMITPYLVRPFADNQAAVDAPASAAPEKLSSNTVNGIPRLSVEDLGTLPDEEGAAMAAAPSKKAVIGMAPPSGLSTGATLSEVPPTARAPQQQREENALSHVFEQNMKRNFGSARINNATKDVGSFGYMTD